MSRAGAPRRPLLLLSFALSLTACVPDVELARAPSASMSGDRWIVVDSGSAADLRAVWGSSPDDIWAVGDRGTVLRWNGTAWRLINTGIAANFASVWTDGPNNAWIVGSDPTNEPRVLHWDGTAFRPVFVPMRMGLSPRAVWGTSASNVWIGGDVMGFDPPLYRWDGSMLREEQSPLLHTMGISGVTGGTNDVWAVGGPRVFHRFGDTWTMPPMPPGNPSFSGATCASGGTFWAAIQGGAVLRLNGTSWMPSSPSTSSTVRGLWCNRSDDVWAVDGSARALHFHDTTWTSEALPRGGLSALWGDGGELWAVGAAGVILRSNP